MSGYGIGVAFAAAGGRQQNGAVAAGQIRRFADAMGAGRQSLANYLEPRSQRRSQKARSAQAAETIAPVTAGRSWMAD